MLTRFKSLLRLKNIEINAVETVPLLTSSDSPVAVTFCHHHRNYGSVFKLIREKFSSHQVEINYLNYCFIAKRFYF